MIGFGSIRKLTWELWTFLLSALLALAIIRKLVEQHATGQPLQASLIGALAFVLIGTILGLFTFPLRHREGKSAGRAVQFKNKTTFFVTIVCLLASVLLGLLFTLAAVVPVYGNRWAASATQLSVWQEILLQIAGFWSRYWWLGTPLIIVLVSLVLGIVSLLKKDYLSKLNEQ